MFDLRSDTLTQPTPAMREYMFKAQVGDCFYDEDPSVLQLEDAVAQMFGHEAAVFMPSGTMSNQVAIRLHCRPGEAVIIPSDNHIIQYESGALAGVNGVQHCSPALVENFQIDAQKMTECFVPFAAIHAPQTTLVSVENTHLRSGGRVYPLPELQLLKEECDRHSLPLHIDGARIWNAHIASGVSLRAYGACATTLSVCFSKGLGAPVGSCFIGSKNDSQKAKRIRKMFGGTMRQCGFLAAAALYALENNLQLLSKDHDNAKKVAEFLKKIIPTAHILQPETNIVIAKLGQNNTQEILNMLIEKYDIKMSALDSSTIRAVLHLNIDAKQLAVACN